MRRLRSIHQLSGRVVEASTGISNAYLSQLESGKIAQPSPNYLSKLAQLYGVPLERLCEKAGYVTRLPAEQEKPPRQAGAILASIADLTAEEEEELLNYLAYLRWKKRHSIEEPGRGAL